MHILDLRYLGEKIVLRIIETLFSRCIDPDLQNFCN